MTADITIRRLHADDYDEALDFLNMVFSMASRPHDFTKALPRMWDRDDAHMSKHLAVIRNGRIRAMLGVYPIPAVIAGRPLMFSTVGNVATHPFDRGKGYMTALLDAAMKGLDDIGADASRLGGLRRRYARYGYEPVGQMYSFALTRHSAALRHSAPIGFRMIGPDDASALARCAQLQRKSPMYVERGDARDFYRTLTAWESRPFAAVKGGETIGYLVADGQGDVISEIQADSDEDAADIMTAWLNTDGRRELRAAVESWRAGLIRQLIPICESYSVASPCRFMIRSWDKVTDALIALKAGITPLCDGKVTVGIEGWGSLCLEVHGRGASARRTESEPDFTVTKAQCAHLLFGTAYPACVCALPDRAASLLGSWLPLPLSWCTLDRV